MASLLEEYRRRHGIQSISPITEGVLFFTYENKPSLICLTSSVTKNLHMCGSCLSDTPGVVLELLKPARFPYCAAVSTHLHVALDIDLLETIEQLTKCKHVPFISSGERDQERWLWWWFTELKQMGLSGCPGEMRKAFDTPKQKKKESSLSWLEDAFSVAVRHPDVYRIFYDHAYVPCYINRKYMLVN